MHYHIGSNSPGYMPDETPEPVSQSDAYRVLAADMTAWAEDDDESYDAIGGPEGDGEPSGSTLALVRAILADEGSRIKSQLGLGLRVSIHVTSNEDGRSRVFFAAPEDDEDGCEVSE